MKNFKIIILIGLTLIMSCSKNEKDDFEANSSNLLNSKNTIVIRATQNMNLIDTANSYDISVYGSFKGEGSNDLNVGDFKVNETFIPKNVTGNEYFYSYKDDNLETGKSLLGKNLNINITGNQQFASIQKTIYMPISLYNWSLNYLFPTSDINNSKNLDLTWRSDPLNPLNKVVIEIDYLKGLSQNRNPSFPNTIEKINKVVADNGAHTITQNELQRFPKGSLVQVSIMRLTNQSEPLVRSSNTFINYVFICDAKSIPLEIY